MTAVIQTERLSLRQLTVDDAPFILELLNEPAFLRNIGDKGVRTTLDACRYIIHEPVASYARHGFGLYLVELKDSHVAMGTCGLLKRDSLDSPDIGFAFLQRYWFKGYAYEAARAVVDHAHATLGLNRLLAITVPDNTASIAVLQKLGFRFSQLLQLPEIASEIRLFILDTGP